MFEEAFWIGLIKIIGVNIVLSGDNAVVIALAARSLPEKQQKQAVLWGATAAVVMRIVLTLAAVALLTLPWIKLVGAVALVWIGVHLLIPEADDGDEVEAGPTIMAAIRTILIADLVMSVDNVIAVAAAAGDSLVLLFLGLAISIPIVIFASTALIKVMERWPVIVTIGAALIGYVAGEMAISDPAIHGFEEHLVEYAHQQFGIAGFNPGMICGILGALLVVGIGKWIARKQNAQAYGEVPASKSTT